MPTVSNAMKNVTKLGSDLSTQLSSTFSKIEPLSYVCAAVIVLYIAIAKPSNTPVFFGNAVFKAVLFAVVFLVTIMDPIIGVIFGLAMVLSVSYSYANSDTQELFFQKKHGQKKHGQTKQEQQEQQEQEEEEEEAQQQKEQFAPFPTL